MTECNRSKRCKTCLHAGFAKNCGHNDELHCSRHEETVSADWTCEAWRCNENCTEEITFRELRNVEFYCPIKSVLNAANTSYYDERKKGKSGNYLADFLRAHGDENIRSIKYHKGTPHCVSDGILFVN